MTDAELVHLVQAGDRSALETLYRRCLPSVWRYVCTRGDGDLNAAEDVVSETFLALVRNPGAYQPDSGTVVGWLIGVARHKLADHRRALERAERTLATHRAHGPPDQAAGRSTASETREQVLALLETLPDDERQALEWKYLEELTVADIAARLGRTEKAVEALLYRARKSFRALLPQTSG